jgi:GT2 family glycosyltransferase
MTVNFTHQHPAVSVIIVTFNGQAYLDNCLTALVDEVRQQDEIVVIDNNSDDGSAELVANLFPQVKLFRHTVNHGFVGGCNYGAARAQGEVLVFLIKIRE